MRSGFFAFVLVFFALAGPARATDGGKGGGREVGNGARPTSTASLRPLVIS